MLSAKQQKEKLMFDNLPAFENHESLHDWLEAQGDPESLRKLLWQSFQEVVEYQDVNE
jgi:hypothetical protein